MSALTEQQLKEIRTRWQGSWMGEPYRLTITNTNRPGTTLDALSHAREDVPALLAEVARLTAENEHLAEADAVYADVPEDDDQPTRAQASADKLRALFAGGCMPAAEYTATRGEPGGDA